MIEYGCGDVWAIVEGETFETFEECRTEFDSLWDYLKPRKISIEECLRCGQWHVTWEGKSQEQTQREEALDLQG